MNVLVDTSVWSLVLRRPAHRLNPVEQSTVAEFVSLVKEGRAKIIGLVRQEILSGIRNPGQFAKLRMFLRSFPDETLTIEDYERAAEVGNLCRSKGLAVTLPDMLLSAVAKSRDWTIFSVDQDFASYSRVLSLRLHRIRPTG